MPENWLKCIFVVFENVKNLIGKKKSETGKIRVGILLYTNKFFQNFPKLDQVGEGNTTVFFLAFFSGICDSTHCNGPVKSEAQNWLFVIS